MSVTRAPGDPAVPPRRARAELALAAVACGVVVSLAASGCRIESAAPRPAGGPADVQSSSAPSGELWVYTSMYRHVIDGLEPLLRERLPGVQIHWYQAGSEKVASRLDAEREAGAVRADVIATSDPFLYERLRQEGALLRYVSPNALRVPRTLMDLDGHWAAARLSTMVIVHRADVDAPPESFRALTDAPWRGRVALGDPLTSGTAFTWSVFMEQKYGAAYFEALRRNEAVVAGGNAAVLQKVESGEAAVGVLLLENALAAIERGSAIRVRYPDDGAVVIPGPVAIFERAANPAAAKVFVDVLFSQEGQRVIVEKGDMHGVDPRLPGPRQEPPLPALLERSQPWTEALLTAGARRGAEIKQAFSRAFAE